MTLKVIVRNETFEWIICKIEAGYIFKSRVQVDLEVDHAFLNSEWRLAMICRNSHCFQAFALPGEIIRYFIAPLTALIMINILHDISLYAPSKERDFGNCETSCTVGFKLGLRH